MPKKQIFGSIIILVILSFICMFIYNEFKDRKDDRQTKLINEVGKEQLSLFYTDKDNNNYYLYGLNKITVDYGDRTLELNKALEARQISINDIYNIIGEDNKVIYKDGGSIKINNKDLSLIQCHTINGNNDYYFGLSNMEYREGFCKDDPYICSFTKTYLILDISDSNDSKYVYVTVRAFQDEEVVTAKVKKDLLKDAVEDKYYEFTFGSVGKSKNETTKAIFENNKLINVVETDKVGLEQINDKICK